MIEAATDVDPQAAALAELDKLGPAPEAPPVDEAPTKGRRRGRSGTSGAERARRAKEAAGGAGKPATRATPRTRAGAPQIGKGMAELYTMVGLAVSLVPSGRAAAVPEGVQAGASITAVVGTQLTANAAGIGAAWESAAKADPRVRDALEKLLAVSVFGQIVSAHVPVLLAGVAAAGAMPAELVGMVAVPPPAGPPGAGAPGRAL